MNGRVLVAGENEERRNRVVVALGEIGDLAIIGAVETPSDVALVVDDADQEIDLLLVDVDFGEQTVLSMTRELTKVRPDLGVVILADHPSVEFFSAAMEAGARGVLPTSPSVEDLHGRLAQIADWQRRVRSLAFATSGADAAGRVVVVTGAKGGVGTSTIALHLALAAVRGGKGMRVCLVDLDLQQRGLRHLLDVHGRRTILDLVPVAENVTGRHVDEALFSHYSGLKMLLAPHEPERADEVTGDATRYILGAIRDQFDLVIVDAGSVLTEPGAVAMDFADDLILVATPDVPALRGARETLGMMSRLEVAKAGDVTVLFNRASPRSEVQPDLGRRITGTDAFKVAVPEDWKHLEEVANGASALDLGDSPFRRAIIALGRELQLGSRLRPQASADPVMRTEADRAIAEMKSRRGRRRRKKDDGGQTTVEMVFGIAVAAALFLLLLQIMLYAIATVSSRRAADAAAIIGARDGLVPRQVRAQEAAESRVPGFLDVQVTDHADGTFSATVKVPQIVPLGDLSITQSGSYTD
jgi:pilus assembly protein CpaE